MDEKMKDFEELSLELTDCCPLNCMHCSSNSGPSCTNSLPSNLVKKLVDEAALLGASKISLGGGEPAIAENFFSVLSYISKKNIPVEIFTSGITNFSTDIESYSDEIIENLSTYNKLKLIFSIYSGTKEIHDAVTQKQGSFEATLDSLRKCLKSNINCEVNFVPLRINIQDFETLIDLVESYGLNKISILRFVPQGRGHQNKELLEMSRDEEDAFITKILHLREIKDFEIRTGSPFNGIIPENNIPCRAGFAKLVIQANGNVLPCEVFKHHRRHSWKLSVYQKTLIEILQSPQILTLRNSLQASNCLKCPIHSLSRTREKQSV
ncbi:MAG: hypothetical protein DRP56_01755 [Planctomycetota bacterium]|nr:MAG: hypothetical protein DRP56_01755 [Planctomycetota bacterium]